MNFPSVSISTQQAIFPRLRVNTMPILNALHNKSLRKKVAKSLQLEAHQQLKQSMSNLSSIGHSEQQGTQGLTPMANVDKRAVVVSDERSALNSDLQDNEKSSGNQDFAKTAATMEQARIGLLSTLIKNPKLLSAMAKRCLSILEQSDLSEILTIKVPAKTGKSEQDKNCIATGFKEIETELKRLFIIIESGQDPITKKQTVNLMKLHFLPSLLNQIADDIAGNAGIDADTKQKIGHYQAELMQSRTAMVESNVRLVTYVAKQFKYTKLAFSDLLQEGTIGLIKAVDRFDHRREVRFSTYAIYWIKQTISRFIIKQEKVVRLPFSIAAKAALVFDTMHDQLQLTNRWPSAHELAKLCQLDESEVVTILKYYQPGVSLYTSVNADPDMPELIDTIEQKHFPLPLESITRQNMHHTINQAINSLPEREADVICARFGIHNRVEMTLQEIADHLQISRERVRQIQNNAIQKLKKTYGLQLQDFMTPGSV